MNTLDQLVLDALAGVYSGDFIGFDLTKYGPAQMSDVIGVRFDPSGVADVLRDVGTVLTAIFAVILLVVLMKVRSLNTPAKVTSSAVPEEAPMGTAPVPVGPYAKPWERVLGHLDSPREADWKLAVMEADKLAENALAGAGYPGGGLGERLMNIAPGQLVSLDGLWWAHKVRNRIAHQMDYFLRYTEARQAIGYYEQTLNELRVI